MLNASASYLRMFLCACMTLFSSRWILEALGQTDFGLYAVIASVMSFLSFLTGAMAGSAQRHFAFSIGQGDETEVNKWFNASLGIHLCLAVFIVSIGLPFGMYMIEHVLTIPADRIEACRKAYICTLTALFFAVLIVPYTGMLNAKQRIFELSLYQFFQVLLIFSFAIFLSRIKGDRLLIFAFGVAMVSILIAGVQCTRCNFAFKECRLLRRFHQRLAYSRELISFGGWNLFGALGAVGGNQIMAFIINIFCGPKINASFGIANQVSGQANGIAQGLCNAIAPEITSSEGRGDRERVIRLSLLASKFSVLMLCLALIPLVIEIESILGWWLKEVPQYTAILCRIVIISYLVDKLTIGYVVAVAAKGQIAGYQATLGGALICAPVIAWVLFKFGYGIAVSVGSALLATRIFCALGRVWWVKRLMGVPMSVWVNRVFVRCLLSVVVSLAFVIPLVMLVEKSMTRTALTFILCGSTLVMSSWLLGLDQSERQYIQNLFRSVTRRFALAHGPIN